MKALSLNLFDTPFLARGLVTPGSFGPPTRWWDANSLRTDWNFANDAIIGVNFPWRDQSANAQGARSTQGHEPVFKSEELSSINGRPVVRMVGEKRMLFEGGDLVLVGGFTILCVARATTDSNYVSRGGVNRQIRTNRSNQARASWFSGNSGEELVSNLFLSNASLPRMIGHRRTPFVLPAGSTFRFFDNATEVLPTTGNVDNSDFGINQIGTLPSEWSTPLNIDIAELVIYNTALATVDIQALYTHYFKPKFALP